MRGHGFITWFTSRQGSPPPHPFLTDPNSEWTTYSDPHLRIAVNPFVTTPEAATEAQPIVTERSILVYQGRCDNREEVARKLSNPSLRLASDGSVLSKAFEAWGPEFGLHLNGDFCFAVYDKANLRLVAGRGPLAAPPLYYSQSDDESIVVSSELSILLATLPAIPDYDEEFVAEFWADVGLVCTERTPYRGVYRLLPGHLLIFNAAGGFQKQEYYTLSLNTLHYTTDSEYEDHFRHLMFDAVERSMRSNGPVFIDLSGGLDSSTIVCIAAELDKMGKAPKHGISTISYVHSQSPNCEETVYRESVSEQVHFRSHLYDVDAIPPYTRFPDTVFVEPGPQICRPAFEQLLGEWLPSHGGRVVVKGIAGDEVLGGLYGFPMHLSDLLRQYDVLRWMKEVKSWHINQEFNLLNLLWTYSLQPFFAPDKLLAMHDLKTPAWINPGYAREFVEPRFHRHRLDVPSEITSIATKFQYGMLAHLESYKLHEATRIEERLPLAYRPLIEFMLAIPWQQKIHSTHDRWLQRRALRGVLPEKVRTRYTKAGNEQSVLRGIRLGWDWLQNLLSEPQIVARGYIDPNHFNEAIRQVRHGLVRDDLPFILSALNLEVWFRTNEMARNPDLAEI